MALDYHKYIKAVEKKANRFSASLMSNNKWLKLFKVLSAHSEIIIKCYEVGIWDDTPRLLKIPGEKEFNNAFHPNGINDGIASGGPSLFKEIRWLEFPASWEMEGKSREEIFKTQIFTQDITEIETLLTSVGKLSIDKDDKCLRIYGYK